MIKSLSLTEKHKEYLELNNKLKGLFLDLKIIKSINNIKKAKKLKSFGFSTLQHTIGANQLFDDIISYEEYITTEITVTKEKLAILKKKIFTEWLEIFKPTFMTLPSFISKIDSYQEKYNNELVSFGINENLDIFEAERFRDLIKIRLKQTTGSPIKINKDEIERLPVCYFDVPLNDVRKNYSDFLVLQYTSYSDYNLKDFGDVEFLGYNPMKQMFFNGFFAYEERS